MMELSGHTVLWSKWGGSLEVRLARGFGCQGGKFEEFVSRREIYGHSLVLETTLVTFLRKRIEVRAKSTQLS